MFSFLDQLGAVQLVIDASVLEQLRVSAFLGHLPSFDDSNGVGILNG